MSVFGNRLNLVYQSLLFLLMSQVGCFAQVDLNEFVGGWSGEIENVNAFNFDVELNKSSDHKYGLTFHGVDSKAIIDLKKAGEYFLKGDYADQLSVTLDLRGDTIISFFKFGHHATHVSLSPNGPNKWTGQWNLLVEKDMDPTLYLSLEVNDFGNFQASLFFQTPVAHYLNGQKFSFNGESFTFQDSFSRIKFQGFPASDQIEFNLKFLNTSTDVLFKKQDYAEWRRGAPDGNPSQNYFEVHKHHLFKSLTEDVLSDTLEGTHGIIISRADSVLHEVYFDGFQTTSTHDTRSVTKSFAGAMTGIAIYDDLISDELQTIKPFYEKEYPDIDWSNKKDEINIHQLLTMSSGLDAIDFGLNRMSFANEGNFQAQHDWEGFILSAPMAYPPGSASNYGSASPHLIGGIIRGVLEENLEFYVHRKLFAPLEIQNYRIQIDKKGHPYFAGGWYLTPKDLLKFGQLYLNDGEWNGQQVISKEWIEKSMAKHEFLANTVDQNKYGYFLWHKTYKINGKSVDSIEARGAGGQYIFMVPDYDIVAVITSGNYFNGRAFQPERIFEEYILNAMIN